MITIIIEVYSHRFTVISRLAAMKSKNESKSSAGNVGLEIWHWIPVRLRVLQELLLTRSRAVGRAVVREGKREKPISLRDKWKRLGCWIQMISSSTQNWCIIVGGNDTETAGGLMHNGCEIVMKTGLELLYNFCRTARNAFELPSQTKRGNNW